MTVTTNVTKENYSLAIESIANAFLLLYETVKNRKVKEEMEKMKNGGQNGELTRI